MSHKSFVIVAKWQTKGEPLCSGVHHNTLMKPTNNSTTPTTTEKSNTTPYHHLFMTSHNSSITWGITITLTTTNIFYPTHLHVPHFSIFNFVFCIIIFLAKLHNPTFLVAQLSLVATALLTTSPNTLTATSNPLFPSSKTPNFSQHHPCHISLHQHTHQRRNYHTHDDHPYNTLGPFSTLSWNTTTSYSTTNTTYKYKARHGHTHDPLIRQLFYGCSWKTNAYSSPSTISNPSHGYASSTTYSCCRPTVPQPSTISFNTSTHSTPQSNSATSNIPHLRQLPRHHRPSHRTMHTTVHPLHQTHW